MPSGTEIRCYIKMPFADTSVPSSQLAKPGVRPLRSSRLRAPSTLAKSSLPTALPRKADTMSSTSATVMHT